MRLKISYKRTCVYFFLITFLFLLLNNFGGVPSAITSSWNDPPCGYSSFGVYLQTYWNTQNNLYPGKWYGLGWNNWLTPQIKQIFLDTTCGTMSALPGYQGLTGYPEYYPSYQSARMDNFSSYPARFDISHFFPDLENYNTSPNSNLPFYSPSLSLTSRITPYPWSISLIQLPNTFPGPSSSEAETTEPASLFEENDYMETRSKDWPQFGKTSSNLFYIDEEINPNPELAWKIKLDEVGLGMAISYPVTYEDKAFFRFYDGGLAAVDIATGELKWQQKNLGMGKYQTSVVYEDVIFTKDDGTEILYAIDTDTGSILKTKKVGYTLGTKLKEKDGIIFVSAENGIFAVDGKTSEILWSVNISNPLTPTMHKEVLYTVADWDFKNSANQKGVLYAIDISTGLILWHKEGIDAFQRSALTFYKNSIIALGDNATRIDIESKEIIWEVCVMRDFYSDHESVPAIGFGNVYVIGDATYCIDFATGNIKWKFNDGNPRSTVAISKNMVLINGGGTYLGGNSFQGITALDPHGNGDGTTNILWKFETDYTFEASPIIAQGMILFADLGGHLYALK